MTYNFFSNAICHERNFVQIVEMIILANHKRDESKKEKEKKD